MSDIDALIYGLMKRIEPLESLPGRVVELETNDRMPINVARDVEQLKTDLISLRTELREALKELNRALEEDRMAVTRRQVRSILREHDGTTE